MKVGDGLLRNEIKYLLSYKDYVLLSRRIASVLTPDKHSVSEEGYRITSLYLDDMYNSSYYEKLSGDSNRKKYRLRAYNYDPSIISLECKEKKQSKIQKTSHRINKDVFDSVKEGVFDPLNDYDNELFRNVFLLNREKKLGPCVTVDYVREAYVHPLSNTRITFDKELAVGINKNDFFSEEYRSAFVFPNKEVILEVKFDEYLPKMISQMLSIGYMPMAASKFVLCLEYLKKNSIII